VSASGTFPERRLGKFCRTGSGGTPSRKQAERYYGGDIPWVKSGELRAAVVTHTEESITGEALDRSSAKLVPAGALLVAMYGATVGQVSVLGMEAATNQAVCHVIPDESAVTPRYLYHALHRQVPNWLRLRVGGAQPNISQQIIRDSKIPLPPLPEQRRIAAILDKADAVRRKRQQTLDLADDFLRSAFLDLFGDPVTNPKGWPIVAIDDLAEPSKGSIVIGPFGSDLKVSDYRAEGHPVIFVRDILEGQFMWKSDIYVDDEKFVQLGSHRVLGGDVVATKMGTPPAIAAVYPSQMPEGVVTADIVRIRPDLSKACPAYLASAINSPFIKAQVRRITEGVTRPKITLRRFKELRIPHPPLEAQESWNKLVAMRRTNAQHAALASARCDDLFGALVQHAFRGDV